MGEGEREGLSFESAGVNAGVNAVMRETRYLPSVVRAIYPKWPEARYVSEVGAASTVLVSWFGVARSWHCVGTTNQAKHPQCSNR